MGHYTERAITPSGHTFNTASLDQKSDWQPVSGRWYLLAAALGAHIAARRYQEKAAHFEGRLIGAANGGWWRSQAACELVYVNRVKKGLRR